MYSAIHPMLYLATCYYFKKAPVMKWQKKSNSWLINPAGALN